MADYHASEAKSYVASRVVSLQDAAKLNITRNELYPLLPLSPLASQHHVLAVHPFIHSCVNLLG